jgi:hypothetical protein
MKLLCDVRKADWRAEITVLLYLARVTAAFLPDGAPSPCWLAPPPTCWHARLTAGTALSVQGLRHYAAGAGA